MESMIPLKAMELHACMRRSVHVCVHVRVHACMQADASRREAEDARHAAQRKHDDAQEVGAASADSSINM